MGAGELRFVLSTSSQSMPFLYTSVNCASFWDFRFKLTETESTMESPGLLTEVSLWIRYRTLSVQGCAGQSRCYDMTVEDNWQKRNYPWLLVQNRTFGDENLVAEMPLVQRTSHQFSSSVMSNSLQTHGLCRPGLPVHHQLPEFTQTHVHRVGDAIQPSYPLSSSSPPNFNLSQNQRVFQWVNSLHQLARVLQIQLQHQSFQWIFRTNFLQDGLVGSPCCPRDSQESPPTPQSKSINSSVLRFPYIVQLSYPYMTTGKTKALTRWTFWAKQCLCFLICCLGWS